jgi:cell division protein FtsB
MFSILTSKIFGGAALLLLVLLGVQTWRLDSAHDKIDNLKDRLEAVVAERDTFRTANQALVREGEARAKAAGRALAAQARESRNLASQIGRIRRAPVAADCRTPIEVLEAEGL